MPQVEKLFVFLASPSDVLTERRIVEEVIAELNRTVAPEKGVVLQTVRWENDAGLRQCLRFRENKILSLVRLGPGPTGIDLGLRLVQLRRSDTRSRRRAIMDKPSTKTHQMFVEFSNQVFADGELSAKMKAIISVAVVHVTQSPGCTEAHVRHALQLGATREELIEAAWVAASMRAAPPSRTCGRCFPNLFPKFR